MRTFKKLILSSIFFCISSYAMSQTSHLGGIAPKLEVGKWIKGNPVDTFQLGRIYVLEFWATWCGPCVESIPHISRLSKKYQDKAEFIGISVYERNTDNVEPFVKKMSSDIKYSIVVDKQESNTARKGYMTETYLDALKIGGIPATIVIGKTGLVEWVGSPMDVESILEKMVQGNWSLSQNILRINAQPKLDSIGNAVTSLTNWTELTNKIEAEFPYLSADSLILSFKYNFFFQNGDNSNYIKSVIQYIEKYDPKVNPNFINFHGWQIFKLSSNKEELKTAAKWFESKAIMENNYYLLDTYANLLYKAGDVTKALGIQKKSLNSIVNKNKKGKDNLNLLTFTIDNYYSMLTQQPSWKSHDKPIYNKEAWNIVRQACTNLTSKYADSVIYLRKVEYLKKSKLWNDLAYTIVEYMQHNQRVADSFLFNSAAFDIFLYCNDKKALNLALEWSSKSLQNINSHGNIYIYAFYDTYANLLHKLGRKKEAISAINTAYELCPAQEKEAYRKTLAKIKNGEKTWYVQ